VTINGAANQDELGRHYKFTTLTAVDSYYFPSATHFSLPPGSSKGSKREGARKPPTAGRLVFITTKTKNGGNLHIINLYQFTANDGGQQNVVSGLINSWISRHPGEQVILIEDINGSIPGGRHNYTHRLEKKLAEADVRLAKFCADSKGTILHQRSTHGNGEENAPSWIMASLGTSTSHPQEQCSTI